MTIPEDPKPAYDPTFSLKIPAGDDRERLVCDHCGHIQYMNPKIVAGSVVLHEGQVLLCRRAIEPRRGYWTIPAGYLELNETAAEGAMREAYEEACAEIVIEALLAVYSIKRISQIQLIHKAHLARPEFAAGQESLEVGLFSWEDIPWPDLAFPSVHWALGHVRQVPPDGIFAPFTNPTDDTPGL